MKKLTTLVSTVSFFVTRGFALESFLLVLLRGDAKIVSKALGTSCSIQSAKGVHVYTLRDGNPFYFLIQNYHISVSIRKSAKRGHCARAEQECCIMTD